MGIVSLLLCIWLCMSYGRGCRRRWRGVRTGVCGNSHVGAVTWHTRDGGPRVCRRDERPVVRATLHFAQRCGSCVRRVSHETAWVPAPTGLHSRGAWGDSLNYVHLCGIGVARTSAGVAGMVALLGRAVTRARGNACR